MFNMFKMSPLLHTANWLQQDHCLLFFVIICVYFMNLK